MRLAWTTDFPKFLVCSWTFGPFSFISMKKSVMELVEPTSRMVFMPHYTGDKILRVPVPA